MSPTSVRSTSSHLRHFTPCLRAIFPRLGPARNVVRSRLQPAPKVGRFLGSACRSSVANRLFLGVSDSLPISNSIGTHNNVCRILGRTRSLTVRTKGLGAASGCTILTRPRFHSFFDRCAIRINDANGLNVDVNVVDTGINFGIVIRVSTSTGR